MISKRRMILTGAMSVLIGLSACAAQGSQNEQGQADSSGRALEPLTIVTTTGSHVFQVEIADDAAEREQGLMFRSPLEDDRGMLFEFPDVAERGFWMKNTPSSLDIIYIDPAGRIVSIAPHTSPYSEVSIPSNGAANGVLELRAGRAEEIGAKAGDTVKHPFFKP